MGGEEGGTFDVFGEVPSDHLVQQLRYALNNWRAEHTVTGVSSYPGLARKRCEWEFDGRVEGSHLIVNELLCRIVFLQHRQELDDIGVL